MSTERLLAIGSAIFAIIAGWLIYSGLAVKIVVSTEGGEVANLQLMHIQSMTVAVGIGTAIVSAILAIGSAIVAAIRRAYEGSE